jgi:hypothetical protein
LVAFLQVPNQNVHAFVFIPMLATYTIHFIQPYFITLIFGEQYKLGEISRSHGGKYIFWVAVSCSLPDEGSKHF